IESFVVKDNNHVELTGEGIDTFELIKQLRKTKSICFVELVSITLVDGQKKPEDQQKPNGQKKLDDQKKHETSAPAPVCPNSYPCGAHPHYYTYEVIDNCHNPPCSIL
ncbi:hypothetical protein U1Q18_000994, partial [Sarracenia purpurea var. burkii]